MNIQWNKSWQGLIDPRAPDHRNYQSYYFVLVHFPPQRGAGEAVWSSEEEGSGRSSAATWPGTEVGAIAEKYTIMQNWKAETGLHFSPIIQYFCRLYELNEHIDILEATINFKNSSISSRELHLSQLISEDSSEEVYHHSQLHTKLQSLSPRNTRALLVSYFHKVVRLRLEGGREAQRTRETEVRLEGERDAVRRLERSLRQTRADCERELLSQQKVWHHQQIFDEIVFFLI